MNNSVRQLNVFVDNNGLLRRGGRINNANVPYDVKFLYLIPKTHYFTRSVVIYAHAVVLHNGVRETLNLIRSQYRIIPCRNFVKKVIHGSSTCKRYEGKPYSYPEEPPLPKQRVSKGHVFSYIGIEYTGPVYVKNVYSSDFNMYKTWIVIVTCSSSRAVYLDVVENCSSASCVNTLKRFINQYGAPK